MRSEISCATSKRNKYGNYLHLLIFAFVKLEKTNEGNCFLPLPTLSIKLFTKNHQGMHFAVAVLVHLHQGAKLLQFVFFPLDVSNV